MTPQEEQHIIQQIVSGKTQAFSLLVTQYERYVYSAVVKIVGAAEAEDVAQDVFIKAFKALKNFNHNAKFSTWLYRIAINTAISRRRQLKFNHQDINTTQISASVTNANNLKLSEQQHFLQLAFNQMHEDDVAILTLFYLKELHLNEIAEILAIETNTAKVKLYRARKKLSDQLKTILKNEAKTLL